MSAPGWYPDPAGRPDHVRYFDGQHWAEASVPRAQNPGQGHSPDAPRRRGATPVVLAVLGGVLLLAVIGGLVWQNLGPSQIESPAAQRPPVVAPNPDNTPCPVVEQHRNDHPSDGQVHGGGLSFAPPDGFTQLRNEALPDFATDSAGLQHPVGEDWAAVVSVGALPISEFAGPNSEAAGRVLQCIAGSSFYGEGTTVDIHSGNETRIDGHPAYRIDARLDPTSAEAPTDLVSIAIVDTGDPESLGVFFGGTPESERAITRTVDHTLRTLKVS